LFNALEIIVVEAGTVITCPIIGLTDTVSDEKIIYRGHKYYTTQKTYDAIKTHSKPLDKP
jgi:hypothetical protein